MKDTKDIGDIIAKSVYEWFKNNENIDEINKLKSLGVRMNYEDNVKENSSFSNQTFVITGTLESLTREEAKVKIESAGGNVSSSVSSKTSAVIVGDKPGSKYQKAINIGIPIWNEQEFLNKLNNE